MQIQDELDVEATGWKSSRRRKGKGICGLCGLCGYVDWIRKAGWQGNGYGWNGIRIGTLW